MDTQLEHIQQGALLRRRKPGNSDVENEEQRDGQLRSVHDGAADDKESSCDDSSDNIARRWTTLAHLPSFRNWTDEYMGASVCIVAIVVLSVVLYHYDGKLAPHLSPALDLDMLVIALMTIVRVALGNIVEACICQCAWVWVSKNHQIRANTQARLEDFKLFDEASRGLHLACIGALIVIVTHGFETFSQQMFVYVQKPTAYINETSRPAPAPFRSDFWDNVVFQGIWGAYTPSLSTKGAVYSGILASNVRHLEPRCHTANCTWPIIPTLAVCGSCVINDVKVDCEEQTSSCTYGTSYGTNLTIPQWKETNMCKVSPIGGTPDSKPSSNRTYISAFEIMTVSKKVGNTRTSASQCSLWICMQSLRISIVDGKSEETTSESWDKNRYEDWTSAHPDEYVFYDIPITMNTQRNSRYSVSNRSVKALRTFMNSLTDGIFEYASEIENFSSDWIQAMWKASDDLDTWIGKLSLRLTNEFREHGTVRESWRTDYEGEASKLADYVHVQWLWMIYPPAFLLISLYYLYSTIMAASRDDVAVWKSDSLPMLFSRIHPRISTLGTNKMDIPKGLDDLGKSRIALTKDETGHWSFEPVDEEDEEELVEELRMV